MKRFIMTMIERLKTQKLESDVEDELTFHLEMLQNEFLHNGASLAAAQAAARKRFGDIESVRRQCLEISRRNRTAIHILQSALILMLVAGVLLRTFSSVPQFGRLADLSITIAVFGHLFLYVRGLLPARS